MRFSSRVNRIGGGTVAAWDIHNAAQAAKRRGEDVIVLSVGDPDFATPDVITDRAIEKLKAGDTHYAETIGRSTLRKAVADWHSKFWKRPVEADDVLIVAGAQNGIFVSSLCLFDEGDEVLTPDPAYLTYEAAIGASGARMVRVPLKAENGFRFDLEAFENAVTPKTRGILLANPNNPTGTVMTEAELRLLAGFAKQHDLWIIADEVYADLVFDLPFTSIASFPDMKDRVITVGSLSKSHAMTGWRIGWMIGPKELMPHAGNLSLCSLYGLPGFIQEAAITAIENDETITADMRQIYKRRRDALCDLINGSNVLSCLKPDSGMFALIDIRNTGMNGHEFSWALFKKTGVSVLDASAFGQAAEGHVRVAFTVGEEDLAEAGRRMVRFASDVVAQRKVA